jgi:DNA-binding MarR family transcriptional regulator
MSRSLKSDRRHLPIDAAAAKVGLFPHEWRPMLVLFEHPDGMMIKTLAIDVGISAPTVSRHLDVLGREGLLQRHPSATDRRAATVMLTHEGRLKVIAMAIEARRIGEDLRDPIALRVFKQIPAFQTAPT